MGVCIKLSIREAETNLDYLGGPNFISEIGRQESQSHKRRHEDERAKEFRQLLGEAGKGKESV